MTITEKIHQAFETERLKWQTEDQVIKAKLENEAQIAQEAGIWPLPHVAALLALNLAEDSLLALIEEHTL